MSGDNHPLRGRTDSEQFFETRQESILGPGEVRPPRSMVPPTPVEWTRGDSTMWDTHSKDSKEPSGDTPFSFDQNIFNQAAERAASDRQTSSEGLGPAQNSQQLPASGSDSLVLRTESQQLSEELYHQALNYPPPPPVVAPIVQRKARANLWYQHTTKWDITHQMPPPPRSPLEFLEEEARTGVVNPQPRYPYRGEYWLSRCAHWASHVQEQFNWPPTKQASIAPPEFVLQHCVV